jgi:hypothetical protein
MVRTLLGYDGEAAAINVILPLPNQNPVKQ